MNLYAEVVINSDAQEIDRPFTYKVSKEDELKISVGDRVSVHFGAGNRFTEGFVVALKTEYEGNYKLKYIKKILDTKPILTRENLLTIEFLRRKTLCKYIDAIRLMIPKGITKGATFKKKNVIKFKEELNEKYKNNEKYLSLINFIKDNDECFSKAELTKEHGFSSYMINKSIEEGFLEVIQTIVDRYNKKTYELDKTKILNEEQLKAIKVVLNSETKGTLIKGVTGSGKTEVYMELVRETLNKGKSCIVLVPEISLTPQMIQRFKGRFGEEVALFHSKLSEGERFDEWYRVKNGKCRLVIGARSALFLPVQDLGLIIVDEEHESSYKSEHNPKYSTKEVCEFYSEIYNAKYVLGSATPSVESFADAIVQKINLVELKERIDKKPLPTMEIVDMRKELKDKNLSMFSRKLYKKMKEALERKEQIILFLNRRGFSTFISCRSCGYVFKCHKCDISLTYHNSGYLSCHYCGYVEKEKKVCPKCGSKYVKFFGAGTEKVQNEIKKYFKDARVLRMDSDTTKAKDAYEKIYNSFINGEADILIGTQMVAKGFDFKNVSLVGILAADMSLNMPDYRASERTYDLVTQVSGRAGRGETKGEVVIQSYTPNHPSLKYAVDNNYTDMFKEEIRIRKLMCYPPFGKIVLIRGLSKNEIKLKEFMENTKDKIEGLISEGSYLLGPTPCVVKKVRDMFRYQIMIKGNVNDNELLNIRNSLYDLNKSVYNEIRINIDINPNNLL
ncbi:primosomal protein N' [Clostridium chrysemydis]|uniref:primosomal protein N' n=1 Tax=Clostridium chrysemydis TaxID=2665504 RepID=UPI001884588D|nr:primosomal protein N' [Clostridium chrysemydis]